MIRVLHLRDTNKVCGPGKTIMETACRIDGSEFDLSVGLFLEMNETGNLYQQALEARGVRVLPVRSRHQFDLSVIRAIIRIIRENDIHILHSHEYKSDIVAYLVARFHPIPIVTTIHGWITNSLKSRFYIWSGKQVLKHFDRVIAVSPKIRAELVRLGVAPEKAPLIYNAIVTENYRPGSYEKGYIRRRFDLRDSDILIGNVGRLSPEKGQRVFLDAASRICRQRDDVYFVLVGDGKDRAALEKYSQEKQIRHRVLFTGHEQDVRPVYQDIDVLALTSFTEGFPNVLLESLCMDTPIIATRVGGVEDIVTDGVTGYLCEAGDSGCIAAAIQRTLDDPQQARVMVENGQALIRREFQFAARVEKVQNLYRDVLRGRGQE